MQPNERHTVYAASGRPYRLPIDAAQFRSLLSRGLARSLAGPAMKAALADPGLKKALADPNFAASLSRGVRAK